MTFNLLVLASDQSTGSNFAKSLQLSKKAGDDIRIIGTATHPFRAHLTANDTTVLLPREIAGDPVPTLKYVEDKLRLNIDLLYETRSADSMLAVSRNRNKLPVFLPAAEMVEIFEDKFQTFQHLEKQGFPVPQTKLVNNPDDVRRALNDIKADNFWIRAIMGQGGTGAFSSNDPTEIKDAAFLAAPAVRPLGLPLAIVEALRARNYLDKFESDSMLEGIQNAPWLARGGFCSVGNRVAASGRTG